MKRSHLCEYEMGLLLWKFEKAEFLILYFNCKIRKSVPRPKWTQQWELNCFRRSSYVMSIVSIYTDGDTVQGGPPTSLSVNSIGSHKRKFKAKSYLSYAGIIRCFSQSSLEFESIWVGLHEFFYSCGDCWKYGVNENSKWTEFNNSQKSY